MNISGRLAQILKCRGTSNHFVHQLTRKYGQNVTVSERTLTGRIISYLDQNRGDTSAKLSNDLFKSLAERPDLINGTIKFQELRSCIKFCGKNNDYLLTAIDKECCNRIYDLNVQETCDILHSLVQAVPNRIFKTNYYKLAIRNMYNNINRLSKDELIQLMFFAALEKKSKKSQTIIKKCLQSLHSYINELDESQLCIISNSLFKTSTKASELFLSCIHHSINNNLGILKDSLLFISFVKVLRQNRYQSEELLSSITCGMFFNQTTHIYSLTALGHILALYSDFYYYDKNLYQHFVEISLKKLKESTYTPRTDFYLPEDIRTKDINRLLWCLANINYQELKKDQIDIIISKLKERINGGDHLIKPDIYIEIFLYLWMLKYRAYEFVPFILTQDNISRIQDSNLPVKQRLNLLLSCIYYEDPQLFKKLNISPLRTTSYKYEMQINKRPLLQRVYDSLKVMAKSHSINRFEMGIQIPHLNIVGITGYKRKIYKTVHVEVLDETTSVKNEENLPHGLMDLKLRILDKMEEGLIVIDSEDICEMTEYELQKHLEESINLVT